MPTTIIRRVSILDPSVLRAPHCLYLRLAASCSSRRMGSSSPSPPRQFPNSGFTELHQGEKVEEENIPNYKAQDYYPARIGEIFQSRYQIVSKLGFGVKSTVWLCRDLRTSLYLTLKLRVRSKERDHISLHDDCEIRVSHHLKQATIEHPGKKMIRIVDDSFSIEGPHGFHRCLLYQPLGMNFTELLDLLPEQRFPKEMLQRSIQLLLLATGYLHQCDVTHTDISPNNILQRVEDDSILSQIEKDELDRPIARKTLPGRIIYNSRPLPLSRGLPMLCDLGEARIGKEKHSGDIMPDIYRAPEVITGMEWDSKVDIWAIGVMTWDLLQGGHIFFARRDGTLDDEQHLAEMVSLLGTPPTAFLNRSERCRRYWDAQGNWKGTTLIPDQSLERREKSLDNNEDHKLFLAFLRRMLQWMPEDRPTAEELAYDDFLMQPLVASGTVAKG